MGKWDSYSAETSNNAPSSKWAQYTAEVPLKREQQGDSWGSLIGKSALQGLTSIPDLPANLLHRAERGGRKTLGFLREQAGKPNNIDMGSENDYFSPENVDRPSKWLNAGANKLGLDLAPKPTTAGQRIASNAAEFAGGFGPFGLASKGAKALSAINTVGKGAIIGGASGALQEVGVNPLVADLASIVAAPTMAAKLNPKNLYSGFKKLPETAAKIPLKIMGLSPKGLNIEAAQAARDLGIDLPASALTESKLTGLADQFVGKTPYFGNKLGKKYLNAENQTKDALNKIYEDVGPSKTPEIESKIDSLYNQVASNLPKDARVKPTHLKNAIDNIKIDTAVLSPGEKDLLNTLETLRNEIEPSSKLISQYVNKLIGTKKSLNSIIKWDMDQGVKNQLRNLQKAVSKDIADYGKINPEWYQSFKEADSLFEKVAKREKLEGILSNKSTNAATDNLSYNALSKAINSPDKNALIKKQVTPETYEKIQKLGTIAKAMAIKNRNIPNPSGTAITTAIGGYLGAFYTPQAITAMIGTAGLTKLLTDKKLLDLALKLAEKPNTLNVIPFNKRIKEVTGYSAAALSKQLQKEQEREDQ
jgi:hypothetical protein